MHILVACYYFPPYPGIGGRRTAKLCRWLAEQGVQVHVIGAKSPFKAESAWTDDSQHPNIHYYPMDRHYPQVLVMDEEGSQRKPSLWNRIQYKATLWYYRWKTGRRIYDATFLWDTHLAKAIDHVREKYPIEYLWVSVSPYHYAYFAGQYAQQHPSLPLHLDFRDPWMNMRDFGFKEMNLREKAFEKQAMKGALQAADSISATCSYILAEMLPGFGAEKPATLVPHFFDPEDFKYWLGKDVASEGSKTIRLIYAGALYSDIEPSLVLLDQWLRSIQTHQPDLYARLSLDFYCHEHQYASLIDHHELVNFYPHEGKRVFSRLATADMILMLSSDHNKDIQTTKFFEYLVFEKPYLFIGPEGDNAGIIAAEGLGQCLLWGSSSAALERLGQGLESYLETFDPSAEKERYSLDYQARRFWQAMSQGRPLPQPHPTIE